MSNKLHYMVILFFFLSSLPITTITSDSPRPPREAQTLLGQLSHQWTKFTNFSQYATNDTHSEIIKWLQSESSKDNFFKNDDYWHHKERSVKKAHAIGAEIIKQINLRNKAQLSKILKSNKGGMPLYLEQAARAIVTNTMLESPKSLPDPPPGAEDLLSKMLGKLAKSSEMESYALSDTPKKRGAYLLALSRTNHCYDRRYHTEIERGLTSMFQIWYFLQDKIQKRNANLAQEVLNNTSNLLPTAHIPLFQKAIDELKREEKIGGFEEISNQDNEEFEEILTLPKSSPLSPTNSQAIISPITESDTEQTSSPEPASSLEQTSPRKGSKKKKKSIQNISQSSLSTSNTGLP